MTGETHGIGDRYWPTPKAYALDLNCPDCGVAAWSCPCAVADNEATGQGDEPLDGAA